jgi:hypothetical protein
LYKLFVIHDKGFAEVSKERWLRDPNITLQPWGRIEGTLYSGLGVAANESVHFYNQDTHNDPERMNYYYGINVISDDEGRFTIERAIAGRGAIARRIVSDNGHIPEQNTLKLSQGKQPTLISAEAAGLLQAG